MFKKCHKKGEAVRIHNGFIFFCKCLSYEEITAIYDHAKKKKGQNV